MNTLQRTNNSITGSIADITEREGIAVAEAISRASLLVLLDQSGSMEEEDARDGLSRNEVALAELEKIQAAYPGEVVLFAFADDVKWCPDGYPLHVGAKTALDKALADSRIQLADGLLQIVIVSDGEPDSETRALAAARRYKHPLSTIYIGPRGGPGEEFLSRLATATGGSKFVARRPGELAPGIMALLESGT